MQCELFHLSASSPIRWIVDLARFVFFSSHTCSPCGRCPSSRSALCQAPQQHGPSVTSCVLPPVPTHDCSSIFRKSTAIVTLSLLTNAGTSAPLISSWNVLLNFISYFVFLPLVMRIVNGLRDSLNLFKHSVQRRGSSSNSSDISIHQRVPSFVPSTPHAQQRISLGNGSTALTSIVFSLCMYSSCDQ